jgi:hypothetical protein
VEFAEAKRRLMRRFEADSVLEDIKLRRTHTASFVVERLTNETTVTISYPGYKSVLKSDGDIVYDYRVDLTKEGVTTALSHANIIVDLYNKAHNLEMDARKMVRCLLEAFIEGVWSVDACKKRLVYRPIAPSKTMRTQLHSIHEKHGKIYNETGNGFDLTLEELFASIKWIVLQEDINYPIAKGFEGRRMPLARYIEALYTATHDTHTLEEVIVRALAHKRPQPWPEINYRFLRKVV